MPPSGAAARDQVLDVLEEWRKCLVLEAKSRAVRLAKRNGSVTSVEVLDQLRADPEWSTAVDAVDPRFMGAVFRKGWRRLGWEPAGSHARPVARWELKDSALVTGSGQGAMPAVAPRPATIEGRESLAGAHRGTFSQLGFADLLADGGGE